jgi:signal transduction histidine kinase
MKPEPPESVRVKRLVGDSPAEIARDVFAVGQLGAVPTLLQVLCETTGMGFAAVARVTENTWTACAVNDSINFGLEAGGQLQVETTLCLESKHANAAVIIEHASQDARYGNHHTPKLYNIESYVSVPIVFTNGRYFGNLCAIDPHPAKVADPKIVSMFQRFAALIAVQLESELEHEQAQNALRSERAAGELRDQFIAILGHDLRGPLQAVLATGELMQRKSTDPALQEMAGRIKTYAKRMSALIDDVLDFARGKLGGGIPIKIDDVSDVELGLLAVINEFQDAQPDRQIIANFDLARSIPCDLRRLQQVLSNLTSNALTHGSAAGAVKVSAYTENDEFVLEVWNGGAPISAQDTEKVFEPFWRNSTAAKGQGLGLGLHICAQIVRGHGGLMSVTSSQEGGTSFIVRLPLRSPVAAA